jgi:hypothetical protein
MSKVIQLGSGGIHKEINKNDQLTTGGRLGTEGVGGRLDTEASMHMLLQFFQALWMDYINKDLKTHLVFLGLSVERLKWKGSL